MTPEMKSTIRNPVLPGFNADPSIVRAGGSYWIATSTMEWFPGVALYRSADLADWELVRNILDRPSQLELRGVGESCGIWAPNLSYSETDGLWYLAFTVMSNLSASFFDLKNYLVTAADPLGEWSDPTYLTSLGFDPALFHDDDGRTWLTGLDWEFRKGYKHPGEIILQELDRETRRLIGPKREISDGNPCFGCTEGPQIFKRKGWYYLLTAEGGTGYGHAVLTYRSRKISGPYESSPHGPLLTSRANPFPEQDDPDPDFLKERFFNPDAELQKAGHGYLVDTPDDGTYLSHLCARPVGAHRRCILNRETGLQKVEWPDDWPVLAGGDPRPRVLVPGPKRKAGVSAGEPAEKPAPAVSSPGRHLFEGPALSPHFYSLRCPIDEDWCSLTRNPGSLSLRGRNSPYDRLENSLIVRRIQHFDFHAETRVHFHPDNFRQMAGLILMNGSGTWYYLRLYFSDSLGVPTLGIMTSDQGEPDELLDARVALPPELLTGGLRLSAEFHPEGIQFFWALGPAEDRGSDTRAVDDFRPIGPALDATKLSDEYNNGGRGAFSGTFLGFCVMDLDRQDSWATFDYLDYIPCEAHR